MGTESSNNQYFPLKVSVIIPTYRRYNYLLKLLDALCELDPSPDEILIIDQSEFIEIDQASELKKIIKNHPTIRWIKLDTPSAPVARNIGITEAKYEILLFLDDDILPLDSKFIYAHVSPYGDPCVSAVAGPILYSPDEPLQFDLDEKKLQEKKKSFPGAWLFSGLNWNHGIREPRIMFPTCNASVRRKVALALSGFDENLPLADDHDFAARLDKQGYICMWEPKARVLHLGARTGGVRSPHMHRNKWFNWRDRLILSHGMYFWIKNYANPYILRYCFINLFIRSCINRETILNPVLFINRFIMNITFILWIILVRRNLLGSRQHFYQEVLLKD